MNQTSVYEQFKEAAEQFSSQIAVVEDGQTLTYKQLNERACMIEENFRFAEVLARNKSRQYASPIKISHEGNSRSKFIGIVTDHGADQIASILAVLKSGAAYVPAEPDFPEERIRFMMKESGVDFIITHRKYQERLNGFPLLFLEDIKEQISLSPETTEINSSSLAYVLYTSGSTGEPKGVSVTNANVCHYVMAFRHEFHPIPGDVMLQYSVCSFDIFVEEVFTTLLSGAALAIPKGQTRENIRLLMDFVRENKVTIISGFPYLLMEMNELDKIPSCIRLLISGGDILRESYVDHLLPQATIYNTYGPSETTVCCSYFCCNGQNALKDGTYPIGKAVLGSEITLMDEDMNPVPVGCVGEICISGDGVSDGYLDKTKNKMFVTEANGKTLYRSGDLGQFLPDGNLAFLHRKDSQVMIFGKRVEPEEVENVLCSLEEVEASVVCPFTDEHGLSYLTAYVVVSENFDFVLSDVRKKMSRYLTPFMIPEFFVVLDHIPLTPNGKPDLKSLPDVLKEGEC